MLRVTSAAQDHRIARLQTQCAGICSDVRAAFVDNADDAERCAHTFDVKSVGSVPFGDDFTDRILEVRDGMDAVGDGTDACGVELQPVEHGGGEPGLFACVHVEDIGVENLVGVADDRVGHGHQGGVLALG